MRGTVGKLKYLSEKKGEAISVFTELFAQLSKVGLPLRAEIHRVRETRDAVLQIEQRSGHDIVVTEASMPQPKIKENAFASA